MLNKFLVIGFDSEFSYDEVIKDKNLINYMANKKYMYFDNRIKQFDIDGTFAYVSKYGGIIKYEEVKREDVEELLEWRMTLK